MELPGNSQKNRLRPKTALRGQGLNGSQNSHVFLDLFYQARKSAPFRRRDVGQSRSPFFPSGFQDSLQDADSVFRHEVAFPVMTISKVTTGYQHAIYPFLQGH